METQTVGPSPAEVEAGRDLVDLQSLDLPLDQQNLDPGLDLDPDLLSLVRDPPCQEPALLNREVDLPSLEVDLLNQELDRQDLAEDHLNQELVLPVLPDPNLELEVDQAALQGQSQDHLLDLKVVLLLLVLSQEVLGQKREVLLQLGQEVEVLLGQNQRVQPDPNQGAVPGQNLGVLPDRSLEVLPETSQDPVPSQDPDRDHDLQPPNPGVAPDHDLEDPTLHLQKGKECQTVTQI